MNNVQHDDAAQDVDMIKSVLQKLIDDMDGIEANRINPKISKVEVAAVAPKSDAQDQTDEGLDPEILGKLLDKAGSADDSGALPEDKSEGLPDEVMMAVKKKKGLTQ